MQNHLIPRTRSYCLSAKETANSEEFTVLPVHQDSGACEQGRNPQSLLPADRLVTTVINLSPSGVHPTIGGRG